MESIKMVYKFSDEDGEDIKEIKCSRENEDGLHDYDVCEMFMDFMRSVGFAESNVISYFKD